MTEPEKRAGMAAYGNDSRLSGVEWDHLVSVSLGGAVNDPRNEWPEKRASPNPKDQLESVLHDAVCDGRTRLREAQLAIARDRYGAWLKAGRP